MAADGTRLLSAESAAAMAAHQADLPDQWSLGDSWGLGWIRYDWHGARLVGHDGGTFGQGAFLRLLPGPQQGEGLTVALLTNGGGMVDLYEDLYRELFAELAGVTVPDPLDPPAEPPAQDLSRFVGRYERHSVEIEVFEQDGGLVLRQTAVGAVAEATGQPVQEHALVPVSDGVFALRAVGRSGWSAVTFYALPDGSRYVHTGGRANPRTTRPEEGPTR
ncbi:hypothetical protein A7K94_0221515 [Modestobacter sp. VKM Ac-2676]|nr:hypothetical protein A7K94_0221515 [Modestobacter sp. VKM Ac-2676]